MGIFDEFKKTVSKSSKRESSIFGDESVEEDVSGIFPDIEDAPNGMFDGAFLPDGDSLEQSYEGTYEIEKNNISGLNLPDNNVAVPHYFSQSSIYAPRSGDRVVEHTRMDLWSQGNLKVGYQGPHLDTKIDYKLMSLVLKARDKLDANSHIVVLKYKETMLALGLNPLHPDSRRKFHSSIARHISAKFYFSVDDENAGTWRPFFDAENTYYNYKENILQVQLSSVIPKLFQQSKTGSFSIEDMVLNFGLKSSYSSKIYSYYESNREPFPIKMSTILKICDKKGEGVDGAPTSNQKTTIKKALEELVKVGFLSSFEIIKKNRSDKDPMVKVKKTPRENRVIKETISIKSFVSSIPSD